MVCSDSQWIIGVILVRFIHILKLCFKFICAHTYIVFKQCRHYFTKKIYVCIILSTTGAFGVVHKGELLISDGVIRAVAIKTIKCKFCVSVYYLCTVLSAA